LNDFFGWVDPLRSPSLEDLHEQAVRGHRGPLNDNQSRIEVRDLYMLWELDCRHHHHSSDRPYLNLLLGQLGIWVIDDDVVSIRIGIEIVLVIVVVILDP